MNPIDKAKAHFREQMTDSLKLACNVPEWDMDIYYRSVNNLQQEAEIVKLQQEGKTVESLALTLILKAKDAEGKAIFQRGNKAELMTQVDPNVILRILTAMSEGGDADVSMEDLGNS